MINKELLEYIKLLSSSDKKTLSQKALKACEEVGELAKAVLPFENASGTTHRFVDKKKILEESVDTILCALSIIFDIQATPEEIEEEFDRKSKKWGGLQAREGKIKGPIPYEIHITVAAPPDEEHLEWFRRVCKTMGAKPIILDLQDADGKTVMHDIMTSSVFLGDNKGAYEEMERIAKGLHMCHFEVLRKKIETVPWHPAAPSRETGVRDMPPNCYFESHLAVMCQQEQLEELRQLASTYDLHCSRNVFKKYDDGMVKQMLTYRKYDSHYECFQMELEKRTTFLTAHGYTPDKVITEFSIYDTKISHDNSWIAK